MYYVIKTKGSYPEGCFENIIKITTSKKRGINIFNDVVQRFINDFKKNNIVFNKIITNRYTTLKSTDVQITVYLLNMSANDIENI